MTVAKLINLLSKSDPNSIVILSKDAEGNGYSPLDSLTNAYYHAETTWYGEVTDDGEGGKPALVLYPIN
jgi:hypothetical protein